MQLGRDKDGSWAFCPLYLKRDDTYDEWHGTPAAPGEEWHLGMACPPQLWETSPLTFTTKETREDGSHYYDLHHIALPEEFQGMTWEDEPADVRIVPDSEGPMWLVRDADESFHLFGLEPRRNAMHPWWSASGNIALDKTLEDFNDMTFDSEPRRVTFKRI